MDDKTLRVLQATYHTFRRLHDQFQDKSKLLLGSSIVDAIDEDIAAVEGVMPGLLPAFDRRAAE